MLEAKWHASPRPASDLYSFKGKVDGKLVGTLGVFISMSKYADDAIGAFQKGKDLNVICFDSSDIQAVVLEGRTFAEILKWKIRKVSETGSVYVPYEMEAQVAKAARQDVREIARRSIPESVGKFVADSSLVGIGVRCRKRKSPPCPSRKMLSKMRRG